jgi:hypothetical protein
VSELATVGAGAGRIVPGAVCRVSRHRQWMCGQWRQVNLWDLASVLHSPNLDRHKYAVPLAGAVVLEECADRGGGVAD